MSDPCCRSLTVRSAAIFIPIMAWLPVGCGALAKVKKRLVSRCHPPILARAWPARGAGGLRAVWWEPGQPWACREGPGV